MDEMFKTINMVLERAEKEEWLDKLKLIFAQKRTVLVLGTSGVGKTTFIESLNTSMPRVIHYLTRTEVAQKYKLKFPKAKILFVDTPGQQLHKSRRDQAVREALKSPHFGLINVVAYGYHEHSTGLEDAFDRQRNVSRTYLANHRKLEIEEMLRWNTLLGSPSSTSWFMTVINKADLWWANRKNVVEHYKKGQYYRKMGRLKTLKPIVVEYCSVIHKFYGIGKVSGAFDVEVRETLNAALIKSLLILARDSYGE